MRAVRIQRRVRGDGAAVNNVRVVHRNHILTERREVERAPNEAIGALVSPEAEQRLRAATH